MLRCQEEVHPKARFARSTQKMVLPIDEHYDVTTDVSSEVVYDARSRQKLDKNDVDARLNEPEDFEDDDE